MNSKTMCGLIGYIYNRYEGYTLDKIFSSSVQKNLSNIQPLNILRKKLTNLTGI